MKSKTLLMLISLLACASAHAWDCSYWSQSSAPTAECYKAPTAAGSTASATQSQGQGQAQGQVQGQGQGQSQQSANTNSNKNSNANTNANSNKNSNLNVAGANSAAQSSSSTVSTASNQGNAQTIEIGGNRVAAASANAGVGETTAQCRFHDGAGVQLIGLGFSFGKSRADRDCRRLAYAEKLLAMGDTAAANHLLCSIADIREAMGTLEECLGLMNQLHPIATPDTAVTYVTREELAAVIKRGLIK